MLERVKFYGFDMDYTLASKSVGMLGKAAYSLVSDPEC
jgi:hypothetical protein